MPNQARKKARTTRAVKQKPTQVVEAITSGPGPTPGDPYWLHDHETFDFWAAGPDSMSSQALHVLAESPLSVPDVCALRTTDLEGATGNPNGTLTIDALPSVDGKPRHVTVSSEVVEEMDHALQEVTYAGGSGSFGLPLFGVPMALGRDPTGVRERVPLSVPQLTYLAALVGMRCGIDVRPLLARGIAGDAS